ncbi:MAG: hypothetical protein ACP5G6_05420 [Conexivisphaera sp.]|jgi:hypothetical protein|nr:hypothetical protein [Conexivisphaerales archaeon]
MPVPSAYEVLEELLEYVLSPSGKGGGGRSASETLGEPRSWRELVDFRELIEALCGEITARTLEETSR